MLLVLALTFFSRKIFIEALGVNLVGLTATLQSILGFLNLAELGIVSAIASTLYKPLYDNDKIKINHIISIYGYLYRIIGFAILVLGCILALFLPLIFKESGVELYYVYGGYFTYLGTSLIGYFISYRQTLLDADQKQYVIVVITNLANIGKLILQIVCLKFWGGNYIEWLIIELLFGTIYGFWINNRVNKYYPGLHTSYKLGQRVRKQYKELFTTIKNVIPHKLGAFMLNQTSSILIYAFSSLSMVTMYTNYTMILSKAVFIINTIFNGVGGSIGNLIAEGEKTSIKKVFWELHFIFFLLGGILTICSFYLVESFIRLWLGNEFILNREVFYVILLNTFIAVIRTPVGLYLNGYILFKDVWAPIVEGVINIIIAIGLGYYWGILGVLLGSSVSLVLIIIIWKPYFLYKEAFHERVMEYWIEFFKYILALILTWLVVSIYVKTSFYLVNNSLVNWIINASVLVIIIIMVYTFFTVFTCRGGREVFTRVIQSIVK